MLCPFVPEWRQNVAVSMMKPEAAFFTNALWFIISVIISAPHSIKSQLIEASRQQGFGRFRYKTLPPIGLANPIAYLGLARLHGCRVKAIRKHNPATAYWFSRFFQNDSKCLRSCKYSPDYFKTIFHRRMGQPPGNGSNIRITCIFVQYASLRFLPRTQNKSFCFNQINWGFNDIFTNLTIIDQNCNVIID